MTLKFGYRRGLMDPEGLGLVQTKAKRFDKRRHWRTERGDVLRARDFRNEHLQNTVRYLRRRAFEAGLAEAQFMDSLSDDTQMAMGSQAADWIDGAEGRYKIFPLLLRELKRRGLEEKDVFEAKQALATLAPSPCPPLDLTLYPDSAIPLELKNSIDIKGTPSVSAQFMGHHPEGTGPYTGMAVMPWPVCFSREDLIELRTTIDEILAKWNP